MTLREAIVAVFERCGETITDTGYSRALIDRLDLDLSVWMTERDHQLDQFIALVEAGLNPLLRKGAADFADEWNLQLSPEAEHLIDFDGATLQDVLQEACEKYLPKEATT